MGAAGKMLFADAFRMTVAVNVIALLCIIGSTIILANLTSSGPIYVLGLEVSPEWQVYDAAWAAVGIPVAIIGGVGAVYQIHAHLASFKLYLFGSAIIEALWIAQFILHAGSTWAANLCDTGRPSESSADSFAKSFSCGFVVSAAILLMLSVLALTVGVAFVVGAAERYVKMRHATALQRSWDAWVPSGGTSAEQESAAKPQRPEIVSYAAAPLGVSAPYPMTAPAVARTQAPPGAPAPPPSSGSVRAPPASATLVPSQPPVMAVSLGSYAQTSEAGSPKVSSPFATVASPPMDKGSVRF